MWAALIMALLSYFTAKKAGASDKNALLTAAGVGAGTYYVATETEWGKENLNWFEGSTDKGGTETEKDATDASGKVIPKPDGGALKTIVGGTSDVLKSWGGTGTAAVIGTTALASSSSLQKYLPWILIGGAALLIMK